MKRKLIGWIVGGISVVLLGSQVYFQTPTGLYPDKKLTPGKVATQSIEVLISKVDDKTYSQRNRKTTEAMKREVCKRYPGKCVGIYEIDHFCSLALGCADDIENLWPQPEHIIWEGKDYGFHTKDKLESRLVAIMKSGEITPKEAQDCLLKDWVGCYKKYYANTLGAALETIPDPDD